MGDINKQLVIKMIIMDRIILDILDRYVRMYFVYVLGNWTFTYYSIIHDKKSNRLNKEYLGK